MKTIILANGQYPAHDVPLQHLAEAGLIVCCDGATEKLVAHGLQPGAIVGDLDSLTDEIRNRFSDILYPDPDQETNDLTKSVKWCISRGIKEAIILGATCLREDHTLANISLLAEYYACMKVIMYTDSGVFEVCGSSQQIASYRGQQVSVFSIDPEMEISSKGLRYPLDSLRLGNWWRGTLNEAEGESFSLEFDRGFVIVFREY